LYNFGLEHDSIIKQLLMLKHLEPMLSKRCIILHLLLTLGCSVTWSYHGLVETVASID